MAEANKEEVVNTQQTTPQPETPQKNKIFLYIGIGIVVLLVIGGAVVFFVLRGLVKLGTDVVEEGREWVEEVSEDYELEKNEDGEETWQMKKSTEQAVDGDLEEADMVTDKFPKDIPLPGGIVTGSSYDEFSIDVDIEIDSTVEEIMDWYVIALEEKGWEITARSSEEPMAGYVAGEIEFTKTEGEEERRGEISISTNPLIQVTVVTIKEILY
ncbi:MAG TPA: hypothetical protein P5311_01620 [Candidatus Dojkabacteria bacterium]|nr:hypothetical protein [Candidatus Dojkabacteria bacterium]